MTFRLTDGRAVRWLASIALLAGAVLASAITLVDAKPPQDARSRTSCSTTAWRSSSSRITARRSSPTWSGTRSAAPTSRPANPASRISSNT